MGAGKVTAFDGEGPQRVTVQVSDSIEQIKAWRADPAYMALRKVGEQYAKFNSFAVVRCTINPERQMEIVR